MKKKQLEERKAALWGEINEMRQKFTDKEMSAEETQQWDKLLADYRSLDEDIRRENEFDEIARRNAAAQEAVENRGAKSYDANDIVRRMILGQLTEQERRDFTPTVISGQPSTNVVPKEVSEYCEIAMTRRAAILDNVEIIRTSSGAELGLPNVNDSNGRAEAVAEYNNVDIANFTISSVNLKAFNYRTKVIPVAYAVIQDSAVNMVELVGRLLGEQFAHGYQYDITKSGASESAKIRGLVAAAHTVNGAAATSISYDDITSLMFDVNGAYHQNAKWMLNSATLRALMKLTDTEGHYIFQPTLAASIPGTILGKEYFYNDDMDTISASKNVLVFGDFKKYKLRIVTEMNLLTLKERYAEWLAYAFMGYQRADGALVDAGTHPLSVLKTAATD